MLRTHTKRAFWDDHARAPHRRKHQPWRVVGRFVAGRDLDGQRRTDARWRAHGTQPLTVTGHASRWAHQPHQRRANVRNGAITTVVLVVMGFLVSPANTATTLRVMVWLAMAVLAWITWEKSRRYMNYKETIKPLGEWLAAKFSDSRYTLDPRSYIHVPVDVFERTSRIYLPASWEGNATTEKNLAYAVGRKIGLNSPSYSFELQGGRPYLELRPAPAPRDLVEFSDPLVREIVDALPENKLFLGLGPRDVPSILDLDADAPHIGFSMATNAGKSTTVRGLLLQHLHRGGIALVLDPKMDSQLWCRDLPNVLYADTPEEIHAALLWLAEEVDRRSRIAKQHADIYGNVDPDLVGPRLLVVVEELNSLETKLGFYWRTLRTSLPAPQPIKPPSLVALGNGLNMGRARRVNILPIAQELLVQSLGGPAAKTNLSTRVLGRASTPTWNKLAPECKVNGRYPRKSMHRGRVYVITTDEPVAVQTMFATVEQAREYSMSGVVTPFPGRTMPEDPQPSPGDYIDVLFDVSYDDGQACDRKEIEAGPTVLGSREVTLAEAVAAGIYTGSLDTLRRASTRPGFPAPVGKRGPAKTYDSTALAAWVAARQRGGQTS